jgi:CubicO group peptidase (beta-lactamase class C family)
MKFLKFLAALLLVIGLLVLGLFLSGNQYLLKGVYATYLHGETSATIDDARFFSTREIPARNPQPWPIAEQYNQQNLSETLSATLEESKSVAFLVVKDGALVHEQYWDGYGDTSRSNSFSMAKTITNILVQLAIQQKYIGSWDDRVADYLPELEGPFRDDLTLRHLGTMTAGLQWNEHYKNPFDITAKAYYGPDVRRLLLNEVPVVVRPGTKYEYQSGATELLGMVLEKAVDQSVSAFASRALWTPIGAEQTARWHLDSKGGMELTYCCFNSNARDFARLGQLFTHHGRWKGEPFVDSVFVRYATRPYAATHYGHSFWIDQTQLTPVFYFRGILGQYIIVLPEKDMVIVRLGKQELETVKDKHTRLEQTLVAEVLKYF